MEGFNHWQHLTFLNLLLLLPIILLYKVIPRDTQNVDYEAEDAKEVNEIEGKGV